MTVALAFGVAAAMKTVQAHIHAGLGCSLMNLGEDLMQRTTYPKLVERSATTYIDHLQRLRSDRGLSSATRNAAAELASTYSRALQVGPSLGLQDVPFTTSSIAEVPVEELPVLTNDWTVGFGRDDAAVVVMGTEAAYDPDQRWTLAIEGCCLTLMWLCGSNHEILAKVARNPDWANRGRRGPYHLYPNDYIRVQDWKSGRHTFKCLASVAAWQLDGGLGWHELLDYATTWPRLGDLMYQIEVSARPSARATRGLAGTPSRVAFLRELASMFRTTARVLLFHGGVGGAGLEPRLSIATAFLGSKSVTAGELEVDNFGIRSIRRDGRLVLFTRALSMAVSNQYLEVVGRAVRRAMA